MHYDDQETIDNQVFNIVVYLHSSDTDETYVELTSIQECKYVPPRSLSKFLNKNDDYLEVPIITRSLRNKPVENYYLLSMLLGIDDEHVVYDVKKVSTNKDPFMRLH